MRPESYHRENIDVGEGVILFFVVGTHLNHLGVKSVGALIQYRVNSKISSYTVAS